MKDIDININCAIDAKFIALTPAFNINLYNRALELEWLIFGIYINRRCENENNEPIPNEVGEFPATIDYE